MNRLLHSVVTASALAVLLLAAGCRVGPVYQRPAATTQPPPPAYKEAPTRTSEAGSWKVAQPQDAMLRGKWWEIYNDPELNALEDKLNIDNQNIKQFFENFMQARAMVAEARSQLFPTIGASPSVSRSGSSASGNTSSSSANSGNRSSSLFSLPADISWEPDLWGRIRNTIREAQYSAQVSAADLENERLAEQASLAIYFFQIRGQDALQALYDKTVAADQQALDLTKAQYETGVGTEISVVEAQTTLESAQAASINLGVARAQYAHAIAVLIGTDPSLFSIPVRPLNAAPPAIPIGVPSQLLERRPDIAASERTMAAANAHIGIAEAAYFPTLTLTADGGFESSALQHLLDWSSRFWSIGASGSETLFDAGLRRATVNQYIAAYNGDVANYRQTVLIAFQQVEDYLASVRILTQQMQQQQAAAQSAQRFVDLEMGRYQTGIDPYIDVITAQDTLLADQRAVVTLQIDQMTASAQLIQALGGGWDATQLPTPAQVTLKLSPGKSVIEK